MRRSFSTEISENRRPEAELLEVVRAGIVTASEAGLLKPKIASEYRLNRSTVYDQLMEKPPYARISTKARTAQKAYLIPEASAYLNYTQESLN